MITQCGMRLRRIRFKTRAETPERDFCIAWSRRRYGATTEVCELVGALAIWRFVYE